MCSCRAILLPIVCAVLLGTPAGAEYLAPTEWEPVGAADAVTTGLHWDGWHGYLTFATTLTGYRIFDMRDDSWAVHEVPGDHDRGVTALAAFPRLDHRLLTARRDADGHGLIELGTPLLRDVVVHTSRAGRVADIEVTGFYEPLAVACTRALDAVAGELLASADSGATWQELTGHGHHDLTDVFCWWNDAIYVSGDAGVMFTPDGGATWQPRNDGLPAGPVRRLWTFGAAVAIPGKTAHDEPAFLLACLDDGLYFTPTDVVAWQHVMDEPAAPDKVLVQDDPYTGIVHVFVVSSLDHRLVHAVLGTWEWEILGLELGDVDISGVVCPYPDLYLSTLDDGVFRAQAFGGPSDVPPAAPGLRLSAAPNPFNPGTRLEIFTARAGHARLAVYDLRGRRLMTLIDGPLPAGPTAVDWRPADLASGVYLARLTCGGEAVTRQLTLVE